MCTCPDSVKLLYSNCDVVFSHDHGSRHLHALTSSWHRSKLGESVSSFVLVTSSKVSHDREEARARGSVLDACGVALRRFAGPAMDKQKPAEGNAGVRVPPKIKIKALEAVKVRILVAAPQSMHESLCDCNTPIQRWSCAFINTAWCKLGCKTFSPLCPATGPPASTLLFAKGLLHFLQDTEYQVSPSTPLLSTAIDENGWVCGKLLCNLTPCQVQFIVNTHTSVRQAWQTIA